MSLKKYVEDKNAWNKIFGDPEMDADNLTVEQANYLHQSIDCDLSPENLTCDGELSHSRAQAKARMLIKARDELVALGFEIPTNMYA